MDIISQLRLAYMLLFSRWMWALCQINSLTDCELEHKR